MLENRPVKDIVIFDLDGTIADGRHRLHLLPKKDLHLTESWSEFNRACVGDEIFDGTLAVMNACYDANMLVIILTGRSDEVRWETEHWLAVAGAKYHVLEMRKHTDNRKDTIIKEEYLRAIGLDRIAACWDDSPNVINHFRSMGLQVYQVCDYGNETREDLKSHGVEKL